LREKPEKTERLLASLKEKTSKIAMGAKRKIIMSAV
jgi:histone H3/H4